jgi:hypothetical protein
VSFAAELGWRFARIDNLEITEAIGYERDIAENDPKRREPLEHAVLDFFRREKDARQKRGIPETDIEGDPIPYYSDFDGPLDLDFSGVIAQVGFRFHVF